MPPASPTPPPVPPQQPQQSVVQPQSVVPPVPVTPSPMVPPIVPPTIPSITPQPTPPSGGKGKIFIIALIILIVLVLGGAGAWAAKSFLLTPAEWTQTGVTQPEPGSWYRPGTENFRFKFPQGWEVAGVESAVLPNGLTDPSFALRKTGTACVIAEVSGEQPQGAWIQLSKADDVDSEYGHFQGSWYVPSSISETYLVPDQGRLYVPGDFRVSNAFNDWAGPFVLRTTDGTSVPDECSTDLNGLLMTLEPYYETMTLASSSQGVLTTQLVRHTTRIATTTTDDSYMFLGFTADGSSEVKEVMRLPEGIGATGLTVSEGKLYGAANTYLPPDDEQVHFNSSILALDPVAGKSQEISGSAKPESYISSIYMRSGVIYFIRGNSKFGYCGGGSSTCPADLYSIPVTGGEPTLIARLKFGDNIVGYVEEEKAFYLRKNYSDAGCFTTYLSKVVGSKEQDLGKYGACSDGTEREQIVYNRVRDKITSILEKAVPSKTLSTGVKVNGMDWQPVAEKFKGYVAFYFDK